MLFHLRMSPSGGIAKSRYDRVGVVIEMVVSLSFRRSAATEKSFDSRERLVRTATPFVIPKERSD